MYKGWGKKERMALAIPETGLLSGLENLNKKIKILVRMDCEWNLLWLNHMTNIKQTCTTADVIMASDYECTLNETLSKI